MIDETMLLTLRENPTPELLARMNAETAHEWDRREIAGWLPRRWTYTVTYDSYTPPETDEDGNPPESDEGDEDHGFVGANGTEWSLYPDAYAPDFTGPDYEEYLAKVRRLSTCEIDVDPDDLLIDEDDPDDTLERACAREAVRLVVEILRDAGATESSGGGDGWYTVDDDVDMWTGMSTRYAYHLEGFSRSELDAVASAIG